METLINFGVKWDCIYGCSYPTYEEWKRKKFGKENRKYLSSYPTYEEWKHLEMTGFDKNEIDSSYPTYEEWKQAFAIAFSVSCPVLILPMRNGNDPLVDEDKAEAKAFLSYL